MKKFVLMALCAAAAVQLSAQKKQYVADTTYQVVYEERNDVIDIISEKPAIAQQEGSYLGSKLGANWFLAVQGGMSAFIGKPQGHGDFFDRKNFVLNAYVGKWFNPYAGMRVAFQGLKLKDYQLESRNYQNLHLDFMYNVSSYFRSGFDPLPRWDVIPYVGCGLILNDWAEQKPFALSYGVIARYRIAQRVHVSTELGATSTWQNFDGEGAKDKLGDRLFHGSIGLTVTLGKVGWKPAYDVEPVLMQNYEVKRKLKKSYEENNTLKDELRCEQEKNHKMKSILKAEQLADKYDVESFDCNSIGKPAKNNYSGLNSLRKRMRSKMNPDSIGHNGIAPEIADEPFYYNPNDTVVLTQKQYTKKMSKGEIFVGTPFFFYFKLGTARMTNVSQKVNIKEIAASMKKFSLKARIIGAADAQTGNSSINGRLATERAQYIAKELQKLGVAKENITIESRGGITDYDPQEANRNACVMLYAK